MNIIYCKYCNREMSVSFLEYKSNSYCNKCFDDRANMNIITIDPELDKFNDIVIFKEKVQSISELLSSVNNLPNTNHPIQPYIRINKLIKIIILIE
jgi:hypothetical protein